MTLDLTRTTELLELIKHDLVLKGVYEQLRKRMGTYEKSGPNLAYQCILNEYQKVIDARIDYIITAYEAGLPILYNAGGRPKVEPSPEA